MHRFADDPKLLAIEWEDGAAPSQFVTPARDAVLATVLAAAQAAAARPIAVMPGKFTVHTEVITFTCYYVDVSMQNIQQRTRGLHCMCVRGDGVFGCHRLFSGKGCICRLC